MCALAHRATEWRPLRPFYDGIKHKPQTTFGNVKADVIADKEPGFQPGNFCRVIRGSPWDR